MISIGLFRRPVESAYTFLVVLTPADLVTSIPITMEADYEIDWGNGVFVSHLSTDSVSEVPTGDITIRTNQNITHYKFGNYFTAMDVQKSSTITSLYDSHSLMTKLTSFAIADTSNVVNMSRAWILCSGLTTFPVIDTSSCVDFSYAWYQCDGLTTFPLLDTSAGNNISNAWYNCTGLTTFPAINSSAVIDFSQAWGNCTALTSFPAIDTSGGNIFYGTWYNCRSLTSFPAINTSAIINFSRAWFLCGSLTSFPFIDTSQGTDFSYAWSGCALVSFPPVDFTNATNLGHTFEANASLINLPEILPAAPSAMNNLFALCDKLKCIAAVDTTQATDKTNLFYASSNLLHPDATEQAALASASGAYYINSTPMPC